MAIIVATGDILSQAVDVTSDSAYPELPVANIRTPPLGEVWRFPGIAGSTEKTAQININFPSARTFRMVMLALPRDGLQPLTGSFVGLTVSNVGPNLNDVYAGPWETFNPLRGYHTFYPSVMTGRYLTIRFRMPLAAAYGQISRVYISPTWEFVNMAESGNTLALTDTDFLKPRRSRQVVLSMMGEALADNLEKIMLDHGTQTQLGIIFDNRRLAYTSMLGKFTSLETPTPLVYWDDTTPVYSGKLSFMEDR